MSFIDFIGNNIGTVVIAAALLAVVALITAKLVRDKRKGKSSCGCNCGCCPMNGECHKGKEN